MNQVYSFVSSERKFDEEVLQQLKDAGLIKADMTLDLLREAAKRVNRRGEVERVGANIIFRQ
jgi:hypothetical protein